MNATFSIILLALCLVLSSCDSENVIASRQEKINIDTTKFGSLYDDRDGQYYKTVIIENRTWMAQNLNFRRNSDSDSGWCYNDSSQYCGKYGRLYTWAEAMDSADKYNRDSIVGTSAARKGICPLNWHVPTIPEWFTLVQVAQPDSIGIILRSISSWNNNGNGIDKLNFGIMPGGRRMNDGAYTSLGTIAYFWTSDQYAKYGGEAFSLDYKNKGVIQVGEMKYMGFSLRCIKDQ